MHLSKIKIEIEIKDAHREAMLHVCPCAFQINHIHQLKPLL